MARRVRYARCVYCAKGPLPAGRYRYCSDRCAKATRPHLARYYRVRSKARKKYGR